MSDPILTRDSGPPLLNRDIGPQVIDLSQQTVNNIKTISRTMNNFFKGYEDWKDSERRERVQVKKDVKKDVKKEEVKGKKDRKELIKGISETTGQIAKKISSTGFELALGPLQLITKPLEEFFGFNFKEAFQKGKGKVKGFFKKEEEEEKGIKEEFKGTPTRNKVLKIDPGAVFLFDLLNKEKKDKKKGGDVLGDLFGGKFDLGKIMGMVGPILIKLGGIAAIVAGLFMMVIDGIQGFFKAGEWGTSKVSGVIGGVLGGTSSGLEGAMANMGKWALIGAGIGTLIMPFIGTLIGGLIGAALGFILGWIGGENIAKFFDKVGKAVATFFTKTIPKVASDIWKAVSGFFLWIATGIKDVVMGLFSNSFLGQAVGVIGEFIKDPQKFIQNIIESVGSFFNNIKKGIDEFMKDPMGFIQKAMSNIINAVVGFFENIGYTFGLIAKDPLKYGPMFVAQAWDKKAKMDFESALTSFKESEAQKKQAAVEQKNITLNTSAQRKTFSERALALGYSMADIDELAQSRLNEMEETRGRTFNEMERLLQHQNAILDVLKSIAEGNRPVVVNNVTNTGNYNPDVQMGKGVKPY